MKRLKILLMRPNADSDELIPPIGLGYLATAVRKNHDVQILDGIKEKLNPEKFEEILAKERFDAERHKFRQFFFARLGAFQFVDRQNDRFFQAPEFVNGGLLYRQAV